MIQKISQYSLLLVISVLMSGLVITDIKGAPDNSPIPFGELQAQLNALSARVGTLEAENQALRSQLACVSTASDSSNLYFDGCNVHVFNGAGETNIINGRGNLIVGYNRERSTDNGGSDKSGSHNLIIGNDHNYTSYGGFVAGFSNTLTGIGSSISGGASNTASGDISSISGGQNNTAKGQFSSVSGGNGNHADGNHSSVSGGNGNIPRGQYSSISGGMGRSVSGPTNWAAGSLFELN